MRGMSLFAGAGGDTLGLERAGVSVVAFVEIDEDAIQSHRANFPCAVLLGKDISSITEEQLAPWVGQIDIVFAGFPCQGFSHAGKKDPNDTRNSLFHEFVRIVRYLRPWAIVGENVPRIQVTPEDDLPASVRVCRAFENEGYVMASPTVLNAADYGVPQLRKRCFFVGTRGGGAQAFDFSRVEGTGRVPLRSILETDHLHDGVAVSRTDLEERYGVTEMIQLLSAHQLSGRPPTNLLKCLAAGALSFGKRAGPTFSEIIDPNGFSKTVICTYGRMPRMFVPVCSGGDCFLRPYTINELKQIQGFPPDFVFFGSYQSIVRQIGNAVPPHVVTAIVKALQSEL